MSLDSLAQGGWRSQGEECALCQEKQSGAIFLKLLAFFFLYIMLFLKNILPEKRSFSLSFKPEELVSFTCGSVQKSLFWKLFLCVFGALYMMRSLYQRLVQKRLWLLFLCYAFLPSEAYAYLDPGTGSMLVSALAGIAATLFFFVKGVF